MTSKADMDSQKQEILNILKRLFTTEDNWYDLDNKFKNKLYVDSCISLTKEEIKLIKEWLKNE